MNSMWDGGNNFLMIEPTEEDKKINRIAEMIKEVVFEDKAPEFGHDWHYLAKDIYNLFN